MSLEGAPQTPAGFEQYNSYAIDPSYARKFTIVWTSGVLFFIALYSPYLWRSARNGRLWQGWMIREDLSNGYLLINQVKDAKASPSGTQFATKKLSNARLIWSILKSCVDWSALRSVPLLGFDLGQVFVMVAYLATLVVCILHGSRLGENSNRAGFLSLAQLPFIFAFAMKSSPLTLLLGRGYEKLNFMHRFAGRALFLSATIHGSLWIRNRIKNDQRERLWTEPKEQEGLAAYALICLIVLTSLRPVRRFAYNFFFGFHVLSTVAFFIVICYHTPYATPWIIPPISFYAFDVFVRLMRMRVKDAFLEAPDECMTLIHIPDCTDGWVAGQHVKLRVFFEGYLFESHPLTIINSPRAITVSSDSSSKTPQGMLLAARTSGDWTKALNRLARSEFSEDTVLEKRETHHEGGVEVVCDASLPILRRVSVMLDGPYGGSSVDFTASEHVLFIAGGAGATFTLGLLDDTVGRLVKELRSSHRSRYRTRRITYVWCIRSYESISWFSRQFRSIAEAAASDSVITLEFKFFVTCACVATSPLQIRNHEVVIRKPVIADVLNDFLEGIDRSQPGGVGGVAVGACGPAGLTREIRNAVSSLGPSGTRRLGGIELHTESFAL